MRFFMNFLPLASRKKLLIHSMFALFGALFGYVLSDSAVPGQEIAPLTSDKKEIDPEKCTEKAMGEMLDGVISKLAERRMTDRSVGFLVTENFSPILINCTLDNFKELLRSRFVIKKVRDWSGFYEVINLYGSDLQKLDRRFGRYDAMILVFKDGDDWGPTVKFQASFGDVRG
jgi:hypothetical protein